MRALVTGATGKVGNAVASRPRPARRRGAGAGARPGPRGRAAAGRRRGRQGDVTDPASVDAAAAGCELVFNAMGLPEQWFADPESSTASTRAAARRSCGRRPAPGHVVWSTVDDRRVPRRARQRFDESQVADYPKGTAYERSKQRAEELALAAAAQTGIELVIVNPAGVYGDGPGGDATSLEHSLLRPHRGTSRGGAAAPSGRDGPGAHVHGLAAGQLLAAERGRPGERYILCDGHMSFRELARDRRAPRRPRDRPAGDAGRVRRPSPRRRGARARRPAAAAAPARASSTSSSGRAAAVGEGAARAGLDADAARGGPRGDGGRPRLRSAAPSPRTSRRRPPAPPQRRGHVRPLLRRARAGPALLERSLSQPGNASSADVVWVAGLDGRVAGAMAAFRCRAVARSRAFLRLALHVAPPGAGRRCRSTGPAGAPPPPRRRAWNGRRAGRGRHGANGGVRVRGVGREYS